MLSVVAGPEDATAQFGGDFGLPRLSLAGFTLWPVIAAESEPVPADVLAAGSTAALQHPGGSLGNLFNRPGIVGGFAAGFLGAGLLGLVFGYGMIAEVASGAAWLGLIFQIALLAMLVRVVWTWWRRNDGATVANLSPRQLADAYGTSRDALLPDIDKSEASEPELSETDRR